MIDLLRARKFALSAYGTVLDQGNGEGLLSAVLSFWFKGRKELQGLKKKYASEADNILQQGIKLNDYQILELNKIAAEK